MKIQQSSVYSYSSLIIMYKSVFLDIEAIRCFFILT